VCRRTQIKKRQPRNTWGRCQSDKTSCGFCNSFVPHSRRRVRFVAGRGQNFTYELIVRLVVGDRLANPAMERERAGRAIGLIATLDAKHVGPFVCEQVAVFRRLQQAIDQLIAFVLVVVREESPSLPRASAKSQSGRDRRDAGTARRSPKSDGTMPQLLPLSFA